MYKIKVPALTDGIKPRSDNQKDYLSKVANNNLIFGVGPAGTGKTFLAVALAVEAIMRNQSPHTKKKAPHKKIIITRPAVDAGESLGFLPGDMTEKVDPYMRPIYDALEDTLGPNRADKLFEEGTIEVAPIAFMRGRTLKDCYIILDEAQNTTNKQMLMFLTRIGENTKTIVNGDPNQIDLKNENDSGLINATRILKNIEGIAICHFDESDVVRHPMVKEIIKAYKKDSEEKI